MTHAHPRTDTPHSGAIMPGPEPIGGLTSRVDCELMNQLNVIIGFAELLAQSGSLDEPHRRYAAHIAVSGARACAILRSLFHERGSGVRSGTTPIEASPSPGPASEKRTSGRG